MLTIAAKDSLVSLADTLTKRGYTFDAPAYSETLCSAGCLDWTRDDGWFLTPEGKRVADEHRVAVERKRAERNRSARVRGSTLRGLGMVRGRNGGWE